eukprot:748970_1
MITAHIRKGIMPTRVLSQLSSPSTYPAVYHMSRVLVPKISYSLRTKSTAPITATHVPTTTPSIFKDFEDDFFKTPFFSTPSNVFSLLRDMDREMSRWSSAADVTGGLRKDHYMPRFDLTDDEENVHVNLDLPGVKLEDIDIEVQDDEVLSIKGERKVEEGDTKSQIKFQRKFSLNKSNVDPSKVIANLADGVLRVSLPKVEPAPENVRKITISDGTEELEC